MKLKIESYLKNKRLWIKSVYIVASIIFVSGCKKFISVETPSTSITADNVYKDDVTAAAVLTGIYTEISAGNSITLDIDGFTSLSLFCGLSADELTVYSGVTNTVPIAYYQNELRSINPRGSRFWASYYPIIYYANTAIEGLNNSTKLTPEVKRQLLGEAYFIRGFCYFYLTNLYGDVPLALTSNYAKNAVLIRSPKSEVYQQITNDLKNAQSLLNSNFVDATTLKTSTERVRPNKLVATAMLARVFLYTGDNVNAEIEATKVIDNKTLCDTVPLNDVFKKNSKETLWAIQPVQGTVAQNTGEGRIFILPPAGPSASVNPVYLSSNLMTSFEGGDKRKTNWTGSVKIGTVAYDYAYKYKIGAQNAATQEYIMMMRLGEVYLIRAEARANIGANLNGAAGDLNVIRKRAGLPNTTASSASDLLTAIAHERQVELFTEWGHRWMDLKRTGKVDAVMKVVTPQKGGTWDSRWALYPISGSELDANTKLGQTPGYE